ncbi:MAG: class II fructose-bisphosphatase [Candidatus Eremiobacteraeota bacterium]|nr:class II fructose-bisphosphatase [Candidatus Eremiobacteraeota bacterium]MBV9055560.1 class II fructose-bisphosphatase [Candidatus Eremiobacteraeota bacterium]MBV9700477.1 class II fructose-bisphosphatase [Candidatus Eremiobacteraeota bacterium]
MDHSVHSLDFVRVTESAAMAASRWMGRGQRDAADGAAVERMREALGEMEIAGRIVIGEGERDEAPMLYIGEEVGSGGREVDIAVDPVEGTNLVANGLPNAIAVMAISERGSLLHAPDTYMKKLAVGPRAAPYVHIDAPVDENLEAVANALDKPINDLCVIILDRPRHADLIAEVRAAGARIRLISDGDVDACIATAIESTGVHIAMGTGGAPEGVLAAAAIKCLGGNFMGRLQPRNPQEAQRAIEMGFGDLERVLEIDDLVRSDDVIFCATGITDGDLVRGVRFFGNQARTHSIVVHSSGTVRFIESTHRLGARPAGR